MDKLDLTQIEQLRAIGAYLYEIRQDQGRSLEEIAAKTYIPLRLLKAIEAGQDQILPEPVFVQGFIRRYGDALGLDGLELSQQFPVHRAVPTPTPPSTTYDAEPRGMREATPPPPSQTVTLMDAPPPSRRRSTARRSGASSMPFWIAGAVAFLALGGIVWGLSRIGSQPDPAPVAQTETLPDEEPAPPAASPAPVTATTPATTASPASPAPVASAQPSPSPSPSPQATPKPDAPVVVAVNLTGDSWMQVLVDGEIDFEGILKKGTQRTWTADREVTILAGNAGAVQAALNDGKTEKMGNLGQVEERTFTAETPDASTGSSN